MNSNSKIKQIGVTLVEVLLVMVILSAFIVMGIGYFEQRATNLRLDRTAMQMQQILNAGLAYYVNEGTWPANMSTLVSGDYFVTTPVSPWGGTAYNVGSRDSNFYVWTTITIGGSKATPYAEIIAGKLPFGYATSNTSSPPTVTTCSAAAGTCTVVSYVNIPGQNLNNAMAINFAGLYHHGACVPVPSCPVDRDGNTMSPSVFIVPVSVSGVNDAASGSTDVYPISSFTGYATGPSANPPACTGGTQVSCSPSSPTPQSGTYWRACMDLITERGSLAGTGGGSTSWGQYVTVMALTRCASNNQPSGSPFTVYSD